MAGRGTIPGRIPKTQILPITQSLRDPFNTQYCVVSIIWAATSLKSESATATDYQCYENMLSLFCTPFSDAQLLELERHWTRLDCQCETMNPGFVEMHASYIRQGTPMSRMSSHAKLVTTLTLMASQLISLMDRIRAAFGEADEAQRGGTQRITQFIRQSAQSIPRALSAWFQMMEGEVMPMTLFGRILEFAPKELAEAMVHDLGFGHAFAAAVHKHVDAFQNGSSPTSLLLMDAVDRFAGSLQRHHSTETVETYLTPISNVLYPALCGLLALETHSERAVVVKLAQFAQVLHRLSSQAQQPLSPITQGLIQNPTRPGPVSMPSIDQKTYQNAAHVLVTYLDNSLQPHLCFEHPNDSEKGEEEGGPETMFCSGCKCARYCSKQCQRAAWKRHEPLCKPLKQLFEVYKAKVDTRTDTPENMGLLQMIAEAGLSQSDAVPVVKEAVRVYYAPSIPRPRKASSLAYIPS